MPDFKYSVDFQKLSAKWWIDEIKWYKKQSKSYGHEKIINALLYRLQIVFFQSHGSCPFYKENKKGRAPDSKEFSIKNQKLFKRFLNQSIKIISSQEQFQQIADTLPLLRKIKEINITERIYSATHKLHGKDWDIAKGLVIGSITGGVASIFLGPVIGGYIGNLAGFSGAAATSYGLALLGGGSLVAGGFGMTGGSIMLALGFSISNGVRLGLKNVSLDELNRIQAQVFLPLLLAIGRFQFENEGMEIPKLIHGAISKRLKEFEKRLKILEKKYERLLDDFNNEKKIKNIKKSINSVKKSIGLYDKAKDMSVSYNWLSGYDIFKEIKSWAS